MPSSLSFREELISQIPALQLLMRLGYTYLSPQEAFDARSQKLGNVILTNILETQLRRLNQIHFKGQSYPFSDGNIQIAIQKLDEESAEQLLPANETLYELLTLGTSLTQSIEGDKKSFSLHYIDWDNPANNVYHVTDEFPVERARSRDTRRPDIVCFVNGIPLVVIECKRPDLLTQEDNPAYAAVSQMIRNQGRDEIPHLFLYSQLLMAISTNEALFGTTWTEKRFWSIWKEEDEETAETAIFRLINDHLSELEKQHLYDYREYAPAIRRHFDEIEAAGDRLPTTQDRVIYGLLRPERLLELVYRYIVFDGGVKKIARYQQYFAVKATVDRVSSLNAQGQRTGGVIWHTTGSGKSLTMVMLAKVLALHPNIENPKVILVTDRVNLDRQIWKTFKACGKNVVHAKSGRHLIEQVKHTRADVITSVIDKFETVAREKVQNDNPNIFVLVDESHRSQYGTSHAKMRGVFPNACYIGFTGTPLLKKEKSTARRFGSFIHKYPMRQAVEDQAVVPLLYEGRLVEQEVDRRAIDRWFERVTRSLTDDQKHDLKRKFSGEKEISRTDQRIELVAFDVSTHYVDNFQGSGFKAQLATPSKEVALKYKLFLDELDEVKSEVLISAPDTREGHEEVDDIRLEQVQAFWMRMMDQYGSEKRYNEEIIESFSRGDGVEILIVVDKLLTGFDEPRNTVLYVDKPLREHSLLQAISRVNRLYEGKDFGYVVDYRGVLGELNEAIQTYDALADFDTEDVEDTVTDIAEEIAKLPQRHSVLWAVFKSVPNKQDVEALQRFLEPEDRRQGFYEALRAYASTLQVALAAVFFYETTSEERIETYKRDLKFFENLRRAVQNRYAETISYQAYDKRIRKLMDRHIKSTYVTPITDQVNIFNIDEFAAEVEKVTGKAAQADTIAYRMKRTISENMERDPSFYKKFSKLIEETIAEYRQERIDEVEYLALLQEYLALLQEGHDASLPKKVQRFRDAPAYYGVVLETLAVTVTDGASAEELSAEIAIHIEVIIEERKIRDWTYNSDVQADMKNEIEDYLYETMDGQGIELDWAAMDEILDQVVHIAKQRDNL